MLITMNAKWCQIANERIRVSAISKSMTAPATRLMAR